ncbi:hypothetical protein [Actinacidiphila reveromycinica]|uniref:hypothetical protein n=1 Tax=Actinacidiphila reveromycinica TaxID=659352 RepID=UPI00192280FA|nr:hypothetical protein [Streptomyces sp. SN-593]
MRIRRLSKRLTTAAVTAAAAAAIVAGAGTSASAATIDDWYPTYYDCLYAGNVLAQQGILHTFSCTASNGGYVLHGS